MNPSWHTMAGSLTFSSSASLVATIVLSYASWPSSEYSWIQPESRASMPSEWSQWMLSGPESALLTRFITIGSLMGGAIYTISIIRANPCEEVAVMVLAPAAAEPMAADIAECSLSTLIISVLTSPSAMNWANLCMMGV